ncbi:MAG: phage terminase large subunit [Alphaproteobacteria bacterium]|nr:phage terminase large subunit [Alphaproteobacteria bacterium]
MHDLAEVQRRLAELSLYDFTRILWAEMDPAPFHSGWHIQAICEHLEAVSRGEIRRLLINVPPRHMKALSIDTPVWTLNGWVAHGDLQPGDFVYSPEGSLVRVTNVTHHMVCEGAMRVIFDTRESLVASEAHEWDVDREKWGGETKRYRVPRTIETHELRGSKEKATLRPDRIPVSAPVYGVERSLLIDPYVLGAWYGDGSKRCGQITVGAEDKAAMEVNLGTKASDTVYKQRSGEGESYRITPEGLATRLRIMGIADKSNVPVEYLRASIEQRTAFLQGLMDTDGHATKDGSCVFTNTNPVLIDAVYHLIVSLGFKPHVRWRQIEIRGEPYRYGQVNFRAPRGSSVFRLKRKLARLKVPKVPRSRNRYVEKVESAGAHIVNCIEVEGGKYLAGRGMIATHNSLATAVAWPAWTWAQPPGRGFVHAGPGVKFMSLSYSQAFAERDSRKMLQLVRSAPYQRWWGKRVRIAADQQARTRFETTAKGFRFPSSVGGKTTGEGGDLLVVDDPISATDAKSEVERQNVIDWWTETMQTRLNDPKRGAFVVIMQRLHESDLAGHILAHETGWTHLCLPARYEVDHPTPCAADIRTVDGELLWPEHVGEEELSALEEALGSYASSGQLAQRPAPREGGMFERKWFDAVPAAPAQGTVVRGWDLASSTRKTSAYTVGVKMRRCGGEYFVEGVVRARTTPGEMHRLIKSTAVSDGPGVVIDLPQDPGQAGVDQKRLLVAELAGFNVRSAPETGAKEVRAEPFSAQAEAGNVKLVKGDWHKAYLDELVLFPNSDYADQVDASSRAFARLAKRRMFTPGAAGLVVG